MKKQANQNRKKVKQAPFLMVKPELKHYTTGLDLTVLNTNPSTTNPALYQILTFNNMSQGDGQSERTGIRVQPRSLSLRVKVAVDPNSDPTNANIVSDAHLFRVVVYLDKQPSGVSPGWTTLFDVVPNSQGQEYAWINPWNKRRFNILLDKFIRVPPSFVTYDGTNFHAYGNFKYYETVLALNCQTEYSDGTSNFTGIQRNNLGMFIVADASSTSITNMKFSYRSKLEYYDA